MDSKTAIPEQAEGESALPDFILPTGPDGPYVTAGYAEVWPAGDSRAKHYRELFPGAGFAGPRVLRSLSNDDIKRLLDLED